MGMKGLVGRRRGEHQALPAQRGCDMGVGRSLSSLQKGRDPATHTMTPAWCPPRVPTHTQDWGAYSVLMYPHSYLEWKPLISFRKTEAQRHKALLKKMQPGSRLGSAPWLTHTPGRLQEPGRRWSASHASPTLCGTPGWDTEPCFPVCPWVWGSEPRHRVCSNEGMGRGLDCQAGLLLERLLDCVLRHHQITRLAFPKPCPSAPRAPTSVLCGPS